MPEGSSSPDKSTGLIKKKSFFKKLPKKDEEKEKEEEGKEIKQATGSQPEGGGDGDRCDGDAERSVPKSLPVPQKQQQPSNDDGVCDYIHT